MAFFWALEPEALMEPVLQAMDEVPADEPPAGVLSEPHAVSVSVAASATPTRLP